MKRMGWTLFSPSSRWRCSPERQSLPRLCRRSERWSRARSAISSRRCRSTWCSWDTSRAVALSRFGVRSSWRNCPGPTERSTGSPASITSSNSWASASSTDYNVVFADQAFEDAFFTWAAANGVPEPRTSYQTRYNAQPSPPRSQTIPPVVLGISAPAAEAWLAQNAHVHRRRHVPLHHLLRELVGTCGFPVSRVSQAR